jgi:hypothetical protein
MPRDDEFRDGEDDVRDENGGRPLDDEADVRDGEEDVRGPDSDEGAASDAEEESAEAPYAWACSCGAEILDYGAKGPSWPKALAHMKRRGQHEILGLVDRRTGEVVIHGFDTTGYQKLFRVGRWAPDRVAERERAKAEKEKPPTIGAPGTVRKAKTMEWPSRRLRVLAQDVDVSDVITLAFHLVARKFPEIIPPESIATESSYARTLAQFLEDCVIVTLSDLTNLYPDRFSPRDLNTVIAAGEVQRRLEQIGG